MYWACWLHHLINITKYQHYTATWQPGQLSQYSDSLQAGWSGHQIPVGARFSAPVQTSPGAHPALSFTMGTGSSPGVKQQGHGVDHPPPPSAKVQGRVELYIYSPSGPFVFIRRSLGWNFIVLSTTQLDTKAWKKHYRVYKWHTARKNPKEVSGKMTRYSTVSF